MDSLKDSKVQKKILIIGGTIVAGLGILAATTGLGPIGVGIQSGATQAMATISMYASQAWAYFQSLGTAGYVYASTAASASGVLIAYGKDILEWVKQQVNKLRNKVGI